MKYYIPYWQVMVNLGDGSASFRLFSTRKKAEAFANNEPEPFCDEIYPPREIEVDRV